MVGVADAKWLFCTWKGIEKLKRVTNTVCGVGVILCSILSILNIFANIFDLIGFIRHLWNVLFGTLMILLQLNWTEWITRRFGFLTGWFGRGMFYLFVGTNIMDANSGNAGLLILTFFFGFMCVFVGAIELIFGFKCAPASGADAEAPRARTESAGPSVSSGGPSASGEPTFNVTVTPSQAATLAALQGAKLAAQAGSTLAPLAASAGGKPANPFLGNSHLSEQRA